MPVMRRSLIKYEICASHKLPIGTPCGVYLHGHDYTITIGMPYIEEPPLDKFEDMVGELDFRHLNDMIPASDPTVDGLARYLLERLMIHGVDEVEVYESHTYRSARATSR